MSKSMSLTPECAMRQMPTSNSKAIRVLIVCHDRYLSGANRALIDWLDGRDKTKADITILLPRENAKSRACFEQLGCEVWSAPFVLATKPIERRGLAWRLKNFVKLAWMTCAHPIISRQVAKKALDCGIQIVHSNSFATQFGIEVAQAMGVPHIWHIREFCEADHGFTHYFPKRLEQQCKNSHAIFISDAVKAYQMKRFNYESWTVVYDRVCFDPSCEVTRHFMDDGVCKIIMVGAISEGKGQQEAIEAVKTLRTEGRNVCLYLCGQGDREALQSSLSGCEDFIYDLGYLENVNDIRKYMDIALVCSRMEAFGRVTVEAQYYRNVVIGADTGCTSYLIDDGKTGYLYKKGNPDELAKKIAFCMDEPNLMAEIADAAHVYAIDKYADNIAEKIYTIYNSVLLPSSVNDMNAEFSCRSDT